MKKILVEFKDFAMRGNVLDLAIGVVIGGAFSAIVTSLVNDIITPLIAVLTGGTNFEKSVWLIHTFSNTTVELHYGLFIQAIINFIIVAFSIFIFVKLINSFKKKEIEKSPEVPVDTAEVALLKEILTELKDKK